MSAALIALLARFDIAWEAIPGGGYRVLHGHHSSLAFENSAELHEWAHWHCLGKEIEAGVARD